MKSLALTVADIWRLAIPYFRSDDRWRGWILLGAVIAIELALVGLQVILNQWYNRFYNTLQDRNWDAFVSAILFFCVLAAVYTVLAVYQLYLNQWLQIRWRRWMTQTYLVNGLRPPIITACSFSVTPPTTLTSASQRTCSSLCNTRSQSVSVCSMQS